MHSQPFDESAGVLSKPRAVHDVKCPVCEMSMVTEQVWESHCGGFEDYKYTCTSCQHVWWVDGIDT